MKAINSDLVSSIYDVPMSPDGWPALLDSLPATVGAKASALVVSERDVSSGDLISQFGVVGSALDSDKIKIYNRDFIHYEMAFGERIVRSKAGTLCVDPAFEDRETIVQRPDVAYGIKNFGVVDRFAVKLNDEPSWADILAFQYASSRRGVTEQEFANFQPLIPSLAQSVVQMRMFDSIRKRYSAVFSVLDHIDIALLILDQACQVVLHNECAAQLVDASAHLVLGRDRVLAARNPATQVALRKAVFQTASTAEGKELSSRELIAVGADVSGDNLLLEITPLSDSSSEIDTGFRGAMVLVIDPNRAMSIPLDALKVLYGLTQTEAQVAELLSKGHSYDNVAEVRNVGKETIKSQVASLYRKMNTDSRAGLVRRVLSISLPFKSGD